MSQLYSRRNRKTSKTKWVVDSGATTSMTPDPDLMENFTPACGEVIVSNGDIAEVVGEGTLTICDAPDAKVIVPVQCVPDLSKNLL